MMTSSKTLLLLSVLALIGTLTMPPTHEATAQPQWKKQKKWAAKKKNCPLQFAPGARKPMRVCS
jgi:hypothetical protein